VIDLPDDGYDPTSPKSTNWVDRITATADERRDQ
jgi:hypothetical protein